MIKAMSRILTIILAMSLLLGGISGLKLTSVDASNDESGYGITQFVMDSGDAVTEKKIMSQGADIEFKAIIEYKKDDKPTSTPTLTPTTTLTPTPTTKLTPTPTPKVTPTNTPILRATPTNTPIPRATPTNKPKPTPTTKPKPTPTTKPKPTPTNKPKPKPTTKPAPQPTAVPLPQPTAVPLPPPTTAPVIPIDPGDLPPEGGLPGEEPLETSLSHIMASVESLFGVVQVSAATVNDTGVIHITDILHESLEYKKDSVNIMDKHGETVEISKYKVKEEGQKLNISFNDDAFDVDGASITFKASIKSDYDISKLEDNIIPNVIEMTTKGGYYDGKDVKSKEVKVDTTNIQKANPEPTITAKPVPVDNGSGGMGGVIIALLAVGIVIAALALILPEYFSRKKAKEDNEGLEKEE